MFAVPGMHLFYILLRFAAYGLLFTVYGFLGISCVVSEKMIIFAVECETKPLPVRRKIMN